MTLYTLIYGNGMDEPLRIEEGLPFSDLHEAMAHAERTSIEIVHKSGEHLAGWADFFVLVYGGEHEQVRVEFGEPACGLTLDLAS